MGFVAETTHIVNEYWKFRKEYSYMYEGMTEQAFDGSAEFFLYVGCPSAQLGAIDETVPVEGAKVGKVIVDVYFHDK